MHVHQTDPPCSGAAKKTVVDSSDTFGVTAGRNSKANIGLGADNTNLTTKTGAIAGGNGAKVARQATAMPAGMQLQ